VRDALKAEPKRDFNLIHRFHWTAQSDILDAFKNYPCTFDFSFKYSVAHMYSITKPSFIQPLIEGIAPGRRTWLKVRNDDIYTFRFGDPAYAREYILNMPPRDKCAGSTWDRTATAGAASFSIDTPQRASGRSSWRSSGIPSRCEVASPTTLHCRTRLSSDCWPRSILKRHRPRFSPLCKAPRR
jgi:hypothetical protein